MGGKDLLAGGLIVVLGLAISAGAATYQFGTLTEMGPGFMPMCIGMAMVLIGIAIALSPRHVDQMPGEQVPPLDIRGGLCIVAGVIAFILLGTRLGFVPAIFCSALIAAFGDRQATVRGSLLLAMGLAVFGYILFSLVLGLPFPAFEVSFP
jgi:hypothetical protein